MAPKAPTKRATPSSLVSLTKGLRAGLARSSTSLQGLATIALGIQEAAKAASTNKADCVKLGNRASQLVLSLEAKIQRSSNTSDLETQLRDFKVLLQDVNTFVLEQGKVKWIRRVTASDNVRDAIEEFHRQLDDVGQLFELNTLVDIHSLVSDLRNSQDRLREELIYAPGSEPLTSRPPSMALTQKRETDGEFRVFRRHEVILRRCVIRRPNKFEIFEADVDGRVVIVKKFCGDEGAAIASFLSDLRIWRRTWHPNLLQLVGYSRTRAPPFIVLASAVKRDASAFVAGRLDVNPVLCYISALRIMRDIVSAMSHLEETHTLMNIAPEFLDVSNIFLDREGALVVADLPRSETPATEKYDMQSSWMKAYRRLCRQILYGKDAFQHLLPPLGVTYPGTHPNSHYMGLILSFYVVDAGPAGALSRLEDVLQALSPYDRPSLNPREVFDLQIAMMDLGATISKFSESFGKTEEEQARFQLGDVGYPSGDPDDPTWTTLCNIHDALGPVTDMGKSGETGWRNECYTDTCMAWRWILTNACSIAKQHNVKPDQLVLITGITEKPMSRFLPNSSTSPNEGDLQTRLDQSDIAHFSEYVRERGLYVGTLDGIKELPELDRGHARTSLRLQQRLEWLHLGTYQCVDWQEQAAWEHTGDDAVPQHSGASLEEIQVSTQLGT